MSYKSENWKEKLEQVRLYGTFAEHKEGSIEETADDVLTREIEEELRLIDEEERANIDEEVILEASALGLIDKSFNTKGDKEFQYGIAKLLNMTGVKVAQGMQKQNPKGFELMTKALADNTKVKLQTDRNLMKMFKDAGIKPLKDEVEPVKESVEKSIEKLTEKNMLGRLAKQLQLNETGKEQLFNYFEKGELKQ